MSNIPGTPVDGNVKTVIVPTIADIAAPTVAELTASGVVDISCYLAAGGFVDGIDQATIPDDRECDTFTAQLPGRKTPSLTMTGIDNTGNTIYETDYNAMADALQEGTTVYIVRRYGLPFSDPFAVGQKVNTKTAIVGAKVRQPTEANSTLKSVWNTFVQDYETDVEVAA